MGHVADRAPTDPVVGWRYWLLSPDGPALRSVSHRRFQWVPGRPLRASCTAGGHSAPAEGCNCGIYAASDLESLRRRGLCLSPGGLLVGEVALWGRVAFSEDGFRGQFAYPHRLAVVEQTVAEASVPALLEALGGYGVAVSTMPLRDALGELSAAVLDHQVMSLGVERSP